MPLRGPARCQVGRRLQDWEKTWRPLLYPPQGGGDGGGVSTVEASRSSEVSPPHNVTNPSGVISLHTPTSPSPQYSPHHLPSTVLRQLSEDPQPGRDHRQGRRPRRVRQSRLLAPITSHLHPTPIHSPLPWLPGFQGPLLRSLCDYGTLTRVSPRHTPHVRPPSAATPPGATRQSEASEWRAAVTHPPSPPPPPPHPVHHHHHQTSPTRSLFDSAAVMEEVWLYWGEWRYQR